ncbi:MAG: ribonuclease III [Calditrichaeota bacterium]|nr:MAG: ribonuclease III [Calditrichota bacterium]
MMGSGNFRRLLLRILKIPAPLEFGTINLAVLYKKLEYTFNRPELLLQALKHRSFLVQTGEDRNASNERLELLGDAVLGLLVTEFLYLEYPEETEGILTNHKSLLVSGHMLAEVANAINLGAFLLLNDSEERSGGRHRVSILADSVESLIGALYLDGGLQAARQFVNRHITGRLDLLLNDGHLRNNKSILQEYCQSQGWEGPYYHVDAETGPDHLKEFSISVLINGRSVGTGKGTSKKRAEQNAAHSALKALRLL